MRLNLRGIFGSILQLGNGATAPQLKANGTAIEHRNGADAAFVVARGADAVGNDDFITKRQFGGSAVVYIQQDVTPNAAGAWSFTTASFPINSIIESGTMDIDLAAVASDVLVDAIIEQVTPGGIVSYLGWRPTHIGAAPGSNDFSATFALPYRTTAASTIRFSGTGATDGAGSGVALQVRAVIRTS